MTATKIDTNAALDAYAQTNQGAWYLGMKQEIRICQRAQFAMDVDKFSHLHTAYAVPSESDLSELVALVINEGRGRPYSRGFRSPQVIGAFAERGIELTADTRLGSGSAPRGRRTSTPAVTLSPQERLAALKANEAALKAEIAETERVAKEKAKQDIIDLRAKLAAAEKVAGVKTPQKSAAKPAQRSNGKAQGKPNTGKQLVPVLPSATTPAVTASDLSRAIDHGGDYNS